MNRQQFLNRPSVMHFTGFFVEALEGWRVEYTSRNRKVPAADRRFVATGPTRALAAYAWPASFTDPESRHERLRSSDWSSTQRALRDLAHGLREALADDETTDERVLRWCGAILEWGMGSRGRASLQFLTGLPGRGQTAKAYLLATRQLVKLDVVSLGQINNSRVPYMSSGLSKVHSLAAEDGLVIFDSRVAAALGHCINAFCRRAGYAQIPSELRLMRTPDARRVPEPIGDGDNHPIFTRDYRWMQVQVRVSWLLQEALRRKPDLFAGQPMVERVHALEAALFMFGADLTNHSLAQDRAGPGRPDATARADPSSGESEEGLLLEGGLMRPQHVAFSADARLRARRRSGGGS